MCLLEELEKQEDRDNFSLGMTTTQDFQEQRERNKVPWQEPSLLFRCSVHCVYLLLARD